MNKIWTKIGLIVAGVLAIISSLLPLSTYEGETISTFTADNSSVPVIAAGVVVVVLSIIAIIAKKKGLNVVTGVIGILAAISIAFIAVLGFLAVNRQKGLIPSYFTGSLDFGLGLILMTISAVIVFIFSILTIAKSKVD